MFIFWLILLHSGDSVGKEAACHAGDRLHHWRPGFNPWVRKILWSRKWQPTPVFLPGKPTDRGGWWATVHGVAEMDMTE